MTLKLSILISGRGSNLQAIDQAIRSKNLDAEVRLVISDRAQAGGVDFCRKNDLPIQIIEKKPEENKASFDRRIAEALAASGCEMIALAGYMRLLGSELIHRFHQRIVNIHPSLLPAFPGLNAQAQALAAGVRFSGCTVHFVDEGCDTGPIIDQRVVPVLPQDTEESLSARILEEEHKLYPACLQLLAEGRVSIEGKKVIFQN